MEEPNQSHAQESKQEGAASSPDANGDYAMLSQQDHETIQQHQHNGGHPLHPPQAPRELHTAESVLQYMHELEEEKENPPNYKDYLHAQKHLKQARRRRSAFGLASEDAPIQRAPSRRDLLHFQSHRNLLQRQKSRRKLNVQTSNNRLNTLTSSMVQRLEVDENKEGSEDDNHINSNEDDDDEASIHMETRKPAHDGGMEGSHNDHHSHNLNVPWYNRPVQRQRWDDDQVLPHINWGDLFFDLFYVAAAYNLGGMLISAMNTTDWPKGVVYFIGIFGPLYNIWENDVVYSSRYTLVDYAHRLIAVVRFFCVCFAVLSIKPIHLLGDKKSVETFCLTFSLFLESIMQLGLHAELYFYGEGDRMAIKNHTYRKIVSQFVPVSLTYAAAALIAGISFFSAESHDEAYDHGHSKESSSSYGKYEDDHGYNSSDYYNSSTTADYYQNDDHVGDYDNDDHAAEESGHRFLFRLLASAPAKSYGCEEADGHRFLAGGGGYDDDGCAEKEIEWTIADVPLILCLAIYVFGQLHNLFRKYHSNLAEKDIREHYVPNNIDYMIHRYGEWIMLMIGESILSLLIVETIESDEYYTIAALGCLTVIVLQMLKFESEPSHADGHALWRSMFAASLFSILIQILSMGLIAFGVSYKIMLSNVFQEELAKELKDILQNAYEDEGHRRLAGVPTVTDTAVASLFSGALSIVLLSLEMMLGTHKGVTKSYQLLFHEIETFHIFSLNWPLMFISLFKIGIMCFTATLSHWATDPTQVTIAGFLIVTAMAVTRIVGWGFVNHEEEIFGALNFVADQTKDLGRNVLQTTQNVGTGLINTTHSVGADLLSTTHSVARTTTTIAKKTLLSRPSSGLNSSLASFASITEEESAMDRGLWDTAFDAIVVTDRIGEIKYVNQMVLTEFGYDSENELLGKNVSVLVGGGDAKHHHAYMARFNKNDKNSTTIGKQRKLKAQRKDGTDFPCIIGIKEIPQSSLLVGYIRPTKEVAEPVTTANEVDETSFDSIIVIDPKGIIVGVNMTTINEFGYNSKEELIGNSISMLVGGGEAENHDAYLANFDETNRDNTSIGYERVLHAKRKDGGEFPCAIGIRRAPDGEKLIGYVRNMTGITPEATALKEKTKYLVDDTSFDSIIITDAEGVMLAVNATAVEEFGYNAKAELVGNNIKILVGGGHAKHHDRYLKNFRKKKKDETTIGRQRKLKARRKDGTDFTCVIGIKTVPDTPYLIGYIRSTEGLTRKEASAAYDNVSAISTGRSAVTGISGGSIGTGANSGGSGGDGGDILDESFDAIIVTDFKGVIRRVNQTVLDIFRYEAKDDLVGKNISMLVGGPDAEMHDRYLERFQKEGKKSSQIGKQRVLYSKRRDGTEFPCIVGIKRTPKNDGLVGWIRDMSDIKDDERKSSVHITGMNLLDPIEKLIDDTSFDAIIVTDFKGVIQRVNETTVREFRYDSAEELIGRNVSDLVGGKVKPSTHDRYMQRFQKAGKTSTTIGKQRVLKSKRKDGTEFRCIIGINKIPDTTEELLVGYIRNLDVTVEKSENESDVNSASSDMGEGLSQDSLGGFSAYSEC